MGGKLKLVFVDLLRSRVVLFCLVLRLQLYSTLFPYTTLFRSVPCNGVRFFADCAAKKWPLPGSRNRASFCRLRPTSTDRKSTRLNSSHVRISYAVFCLQKKNMRVDHTLLQDATGTMACLQFDH